jgi:hypothetical protein
MRTPEDWPRLWALWRRHWTAYWQWSAAWKRRGYPMPYADPVFHAAKPVFPERCWALTCGAWTRKGTPWEKVGPSTATAAAVLRSQHGPA